MTGIYCITNTVNGKQYVGQSTDIDARWRHHRDLLNAGCHVNRHLQYAWNKYGAESFRFSVLEILEDDKHISEREIFWIQELDTFENGYNLTLGGEGQRGRYLTEEQKRHLSEINMGALNPNYGLKRSEETRRKMSEAMRGKPHKPLSEEHKRRISDGCKNVSHEAQNKAVLWVEKNQLFKSVSRAAESTGFSISGISSVCLGKRKQIFKQHFKFVFEERTNL